PSALSPIEPAAPAQVRTRGRSIVVGGMVALAAVIVIGLEIASAHRPHEPAPRIAHWIELRNGGGLTPRARMGTHAILDSTGDALILFGGEDYGGEPKSSAILNDVWRYRGIHEGEVGE